MTDTICVKLSAVDAGKTYKVTDIDTGIETILQGESVCRAAHRNTGKRAEQDHHVSAGLTGGNRNKRNSGLAGGNMASVTFKKLKKVYDKKRGSRAGVQHRCS